MAILIPRPPPGSPIKDLERLWLASAVSYEQFNETIMADTDWDLFAKELNERREEWSPYFRLCIPEDFNVGTTASGVDWSRHVARCFYVSASKVYGGDPLGLLGRS